MHCLKDKGIHTFPKGISLKVKAITQLEFKIPSFDVTIQYISHYATRTLPFIYLAPCISQKNKLHDRKKDFFLFFGLSWFGFFCLMAYQTCGLFDIKDIFVEGQ